MTPSELESLLKFADGDVKQVAEMLREFNMKEPLAGPPKKMLKKEDGNPQNFDNRKDRGPNGPRKGEISEEDKHVIKQMLDGPYENPKKFEQLKISFGPIPVQIKHFVNLTSLQCFNNSLTSLPAEIGQLSQLKQLYCSGNQLTLLPVEIGQLSQLQRLWCSNNKLTSLPVQIGQLKQLQELYCNSNELTSLPVEIGQLSQLQELYCGSNELTSLPAEIGQLSQLKQLSCSVNQLTSLPAEIGQLSQLKQLICWGNQLTSLPAEIGQLSQLQELNCDHNLFVRLPLSLARLSKITNLQFVLKSTGAEIDREIDVNRQMLNDIYQQQKKKFFSPFYQLLGNAEEEARKMGRQMVEDVYKIIYKQLQAEFDNKYVVYGLNIVVED